MQQFIGELTDDLFVTDVNPIMEDKPLNDSLYQTINHITNKYPITRSDYLGQLYQDDCIPFKVSRYIRTVN